MQQEGVEEGQQQVGQGGGVMARVIVGASLGGEGSLQQRWGELPLVERH